MIFLLFLFQLLFMSLFLRSLWSSCYFFFSCYCLYVTVPPLSVIFLLFLFQLLLSLCHCSSALCDLPVISFSAVVFMSLFLHSLWSPCYFFLAVIVFLSLFLRSLWSLFLFPFSAVIVFVSLFLHSLWSPCYFFLAVIDEAQEQVKPSCKLQWCIRS